MDGQPDNEALQLASQTDTTQLSQRPLPFRDINSWPDVRNHFLVNEQLLMPNSQDRWYLSRLDNHEEYLPKCPGCQRQLRFDVDLDKTQPQMFCCEVLLTPCGHLIGRKCFLNWTKICGEKTLHCPLCRKSLHHPCGHKMDVMVLNGMENPDEVPETSEEGAQFEENCIQCLVHTTVSSSLQPLAEELALEYNVRPAALSCTVGIMKYIPDMDINFEQELQCLVRIVGPTDVPCTEPHLEISDLEMNVREQTQTLLDDLGQHYRGSWCPNLRGITVRGVQWMMPKSNTSKAWRLPPFRVEDLVELHHMEVSNSDDSEASADNENSDDSDIENAEDDTDLEGSASEDLYSEDSDLEWYTNNANPLQEFEDSEVSFSEDSGYGGSNPIEDMEGVEDADI